VPPASEDKLSEIYQKYKLFDPHLSKEYKAFLKQEIAEMERETLYDKACNFAESFLKIRTSPDTEKKFQSAINFCYMNISPCGPVSLVLLLFLLFTPIIFALFLMNILTITTAATAMIVFSVFVYYLYQYPFFKVKIIRAKASTEIVLATLYIAVSLREVPNIENAIIFSAQNLSGPISDDLKRVLWYIETQEYNSIKVALQDFVNKWGMENEEFVNAMKLLLISTEQAPSESLRLIDESIEVILTGTVERMEHYAQELRFPVMMIYALGIILPVITLIMFPIVMIFLQQYANITFLIVGYDILLPVTLFWFINTNLKAKPPTLSQPEIKESLTEIKLPFFQKKISIFLIIIPAIIIIGSIGSYSLYQYHTEFSLCQKWQKCKFALDCKPAGLSVDNLGCKKSMTDLLRPTMASSLIILGISLVVGISFILVTSGKIKLRDKVRRLEREFTEALFQLGHQMMSGHAIETALKKSRDNLQNLEIANFYDKILTNIKMMGATFEGAIFNKEYGAVLEYPSELIKSVMRIMVESSRKSLRAVSTSMLTVSRYLKGMHMIEEKIKDMMSETVTSMKFLAMFLSPLVAGITVALAVIIISIMIALSLQLGSIVDSGGITIPGSASFLLGLWQGGNTMAPDLFQLVLGVYIIESTVLLGMFINGIENGEDRVSEMNLIGKLLIMSVLIYTITLFIVYSVFGGLITTLMYGTSI
jgi:hypothetical protein